MNNLIADFLKRNNRFHNFRIINYKNKSMEECTICGRSKEYIILKIKERHPEIKEINIFIINKYFPCLRIIK